MSLHPRSSPASESGRRAEAIVEGLAGSDIPAFGWAGTSLTWSEWSGLVRRFQDELEGLRGTPVGLMLRPDARSYALWGALSLLDCHVHLLDEATPAELLETLSERHQLAFLVNAGEGDEALAGVRPLREQGHRGGRGEITLFTSGSTGQPKPVAHDWETLTRPVRRPGGSGPASTRQVWLLSYRPHLYAGIQVFLHCLLNRGTLVLPEPGLSAEELVGLMSRQEVRFVSATPSYWRRLITLVPARELRCLRLSRSPWGES